MQNLIIGIPVFNEEFAIAKLLTNCWELESEFKKIGLHLTLVVVDDGSADRSCVAVESWSKDFPSAKLVLLRHERNLGLHEAIRTLFAWFVTNTGPGSCLGVLDGDGTHHPGQFLEMHKSLRAGSQIVIASRYVRGAQVIGVPPFRQLISKLSSLFFVNFAGAAARDLSSGFRLYSQSAVQSLYPLNGLSQSFACTTDILIRAQKLELTVSEVPIHLSYDKKMGPSKIHFAKTAADSIRLLLKGLFRI